MNMVITNAPATVIIIALNMTIFALIKLMDLDVKMLGSSYIDTIQNRQYYRIVSSAFTQREVMHLAMNMYSLYNIGTVLERALSTKIYSICYIVIMLIGGFLSARLHKKGSPFTYSIGASGVICGLLGIYMVIAFSVLGLQGVSSVIPTIVILIAMTTSKKIDSIGHFTGLAVGLICGIVLINIFRFGV